MDEKSEFDAVSEAEDIVFRKKQEEDDKKNKEEKAGNKIKLPKYGEPGFDEYNNKVGEAGNKIRPKENSTTSVEKNAEGIIRKKAKRERILIKYGEPRSSGIDEGKKFTPENIINEKEGNISNAEQETDKNNLGEFEKGKISKN